MALLLVAAGVASLPTGCGGPKSVARSTPKATAEAFVAAIRAGDYEAAAAGFDYEQYALSQNPDWDSFGQSARNLIIDKLREERAGELQALSGTLAARVTVGEAQVQGASASVPMTAGANTIHLQMTQQDGLWYIQAIQER